MAATNPFLQGNFAPVSEQQNLECINIVGEIPLDLNGCFLRNGPNNQFTPVDEGLYHWFDGDGMIHEIEFHEGKATYRSKWIETRGFNAEREEGKALWKGFLSMPDFNNKYNMPLKNTANTALVWHANRLLALWEAGSPYEITLPELKTNGEETFNGDWQYAVTAHPKICPETGELISFCYNPIGEYQVQYGVIDHTGKVTHSTGIRLKGKPVMIHDMAITRNYSIIMDMPITFDFERAMSGQQAFDWEPQNGCRMGILPRHAIGDDIQWFDIETGYIFHTFNAWEEGDEIVLEGCRAKKITISLQLKNDDYADEEKARPHQYRFNLKTGSVTENPITKTPMEFPRINEGYVGRKNRYAYGSRFYAGSERPVFDAVIKLDREQGSMETIELGDQCYTGEFVFAPKPEGQAEDDGYYIGFVYRENDNKSECWILDAKNFSSGPVARIIMPARVPYGFHGQWVSGKAIERQSTQVTTNQ